MFALNMSVIFILIITSLLVAAGFLISFLWAVRSGQYEDDYSSSVRILIDNDVNNNNTNKVEQSSIEKIKSTN